MEKESNSRNVSVIKDALGHNVVMINDIIFRGKRGINWIDVEEYLRQYVGEFYTIAETNEVVYIGTDLPDEYAHSEYTHILKGANEKAKVNEKIASVERAISSEKKAWMKMYDKYADGKIDREDFLKYKREYDETIAGLNEKLSGMRNLQDAMSAREGMDPDEADAVLDAEELTQEILDAFVERVEVFDSGRMEIHWRFDPENRIWIY